MEVEERLGEEGGKGEPVGETPMEAVEVVDMTAETRKNVKEKER